VRLNKKATKLLSDGGETNLNSNGKSLQLPFLVKHKSYIKTRLFITPIGLEQFY